MVQLKQDHIFIFFPVDNTNDITDILIKFTKKKITYFYIGTKNNSFFLNFNKYQIKFD